MALNYFLLAFLPLSPRSAAKPLLTCVALPPLYLYLFFFFLPVPPLSCFISPEMICLNKADEGTFKHLNWNQSPGALPADGTTCQDLNGISNLREHVRAGQDGAGGGSLFDPAAANEAQCPDDEHQPGLGSLNTGRSSKGMSIFSKYSFLPM